MASLSTPALGLTQLKGSLEQTCSQAEVETKIHYFNLDFLEFFGWDNYLFLSRIDDSRINFSEWYFRAEAFPELPDNTEDYLKTFGLSMANWFDETQLSGYELSSPFLHRKLLAVVDSLIGKRGELGAFMDGLILKNRLHEAEIVGFSSMFQQNIPSFAMAKRIKMMNPQVTIVMGGANCESPMGETIVQNIDAVDYVFSGPSQISFPRFVRNFVDGRPEASEKLDGVFSRKNLGQVRSHGQELGVNELKDLDYDKYLEKAVPILRKYNRKPSLLFETARGCWWGEKAHCTFCGLNKDSMAFRAMQPELAISHLNSLVERYGSKVSTFDCVDNIMPKDYPQRVFAKLFPPKGTRFFYEVKSDLSLEEMQILSSKGVKELQPGIEAFDSDVLKLMRKGVSSVRNILTLKNAAIAGIFVHWNLLFGFPGEFEEYYYRYQKLLPSLVHLMPPGSTGSIRFDRYSPYHDFSQEFGLDMKPLKVYSYLYPDWDEKTMENLVYFFRDRNEMQAYQMHIRKWTPIVKKIADKWKDRWKAMDGLMIPEVYFKKGLRQVHDTRSGNLVVHQLSDHQVNILEMLSQPLNLGRLRSQLEVKEREGLSLELETLIEKGLVFHDKMKSFISLVFDAPVRSKSQKRTKRMQQK